ncbi:MAG: tRNA (adenosine(37)-N6)-threonylcarbamoyltransferase complex transferase subunit TsaD [Candidatus Moranbacteria bacterium CG23_combo_of_CG06-09_8_20_14_all_35_22]|nr:MAG: tRNA (adenosine(37)-N6)-threonylcarbamoyltransferase complex transferase subunit TsaD [Candidatus Moranbacteria bacterium CG23_combo_of_CG06-09_8_20_14_all_35_22]
MIILGIETSCDETACAILEEKNGSFSVLANIVSSQIALHSAWGGVVPNLAAREHLKNILPVINEALKKAKLSSSEIDLITVTNGPGLIPALLIGVETAKTLSYLWQKPLLGIHHIEGHIYANFIDSSTTLSLIRRGAGGEVKSASSARLAKAMAKRADKFPVLCLVVSGGHTQLIFMKKHLHYEIIGETQDDAVGEAFDKVARILGLGYPGGPAISATAEMAADKRGLNAEKRGLKKLSSEPAWQLPKLPRPMINSKDFNFSFSGLKTAVLYLVKKNEKLLSDKNFVSAVCQEFQQAVCDVLISKTIRAAKKYNPQTIMLAGGVSANTQLRQQLGASVKDELPHALYMIPDISYSVDNAVMIAVAGFFRYKSEKNKKGLRDNWKKLATSANLKLK